MRLEISCQDRLGITQDILDILVAHKIDLRGIEIDESGKIFLHFPNIEFLEFQHLMPQIRRIEGIDDVKTIPFMPLEREQHQLHAIIQVLPDPVFSIDTRGKILIVNASACAGLEQQSRDVEGKDINDILKGFNFSRWLESRTPDATSGKVKFIHQDYIAEILPVIISNKDTPVVLAGAFVMLKSEIRLEQQRMAFHQIKNNSFEQFVTRSEIMNKAVFQAKKFSDLAETMLIMGELGTGKELIARACHNASRRKDQEFLVVKCGALPDALLEKQLFSGIDAIQSNGEIIGQLEKAKGGCLLFDEVSELSKCFQSKLVKLLDSRLYLSDESTVKQVDDVRFIFTTSKDLEQLVEEGKFNSELYHRLQILALTVPSLRERKQDILPLAESFIAQHCTKLGRANAHLSKSCVEFVQQYPWPGNVRQLQNTLFRALSLLDGNEICRSDIQVPAFVPNMVHIDENFEGSLDDEVKKFEKQLLKRLYPSYPSSRQLGKKLGLSHTAVANKLREYGINKANLKL